MIRVRYRGSNELSPGLHATAERAGRRTTVYLLDGMTAGQRRSALRRLRLTARMGHCPRLPATQLAFALFTDRIRTGIGRAGRVLRLHPAGSTVPIMVLSGGAIAFLLFSTVSIHVIRPGAAGNQGDPGGTGALADPGGGLGSGGGATLSGGAGPSQVTPGPSTPATSAPASAPASTPSATAPAQSGSSSGAGSQGSGVCVNVGPLGVCLNI
jgi:hypothetical protein